MKSGRVHPEVPHAERGAALVLVALAMVALFGFVALVVDLGYLFVSRNQLQNVADGSSLAAARTLGHIYQGLDPDAQGSFHCSIDCEAEVRQAAYDVAGENWAAGISMTLREIDVRIGQWDGDVFTPTLDLPDAVEVTARRDAEQNGPIGTFFARVLGIDEAPVNALAVAAMTGQGTAGEGEILFPVTLSEYFFEGEADRCNDYIKFSPTDSTSCGGWTTWDDMSSASLLRKILDGDDVSPEMTAGDDRIWTTGGDVASAFPNMLLLFQRMGCASTAEPNAADRTLLVEGDDTCIDWQEAIDYAENGGCCDNGTLTPWLEENQAGEMVQAYYPEPAPPYKPDPAAPRYYHMWETGVPVYDYAEGGADECSNPGSRAKWLVVGFAPVVITDIWGPPDNTIIGRVLCDRVSKDDNRGGGGEFGIKGPIPGLVK